MNYKIGKLEAIFLIMIVMMNKILLNIPKEIIKQAKTGAPVDIIFTTILAVFIACLICRLLKKFHNLYIIFIVYYLGIKLFQILIRISFI